MKSGISVGISQIFCLVLPELVRIGFEQLRLLPGHYYLEIALVSGRGVEDYVSEAVQFEIVHSPEAAEINAEKMGGTFVPSATVSILS